MSLFSNVLPIIKELIPTTTVSSTISTTTTKTKARSTTTSSTTPTVFGFDTTKRNQKKLPMTYIPSKKRSYLQTCIKNRYGCCCCCCCCCCVSLSSNHLHSHPIDRDYTENNNSNNHLNSNNMNGTSKNNKHLQQHPNRRCMTTPFLLLYSSSVLFSFLLGFGTCHYGSSSSIFFISNTNHTNFHDTRRQEQEQQQKQIKEEEEEMKKRGGGGTGSGIMIQSVNDEIPYRFSLSHDGIKKQQMIEPFVIHPNIAGISIATIQVGQSISKHYHKTMHEFFYILAGTITIITQQQQHNDDDDDHPNENMNHTFHSTSTTTITRCSMGCFYHAYPGEYHSFSVDPIVESNTNTNTTIITNLTTTTTITPEVKMFVIGITTD